MEDYKKKYEDALERAKGAHNSAKSDKENDVTDKITEYTIQLTETIFPELKENEDEKIRKWLICTLKSLNNTAVQIDGAYEMILPAIAWIEKQDPKKHEEELEKAYKCADEVQYRKGYEDAKREFEKQVEQKSVWSKEDEKMINGIIDAASHHCYLNITDVEWLKSLKERMKGE